MGTTAQQWDLYRLDDDGEQNFYSSILNASVNKEKRIKYALDYNRQGSFKFETQ